jgi:hypothetical protein
MLAAPSARAAEGMFLLDRLPTEALKRSGLKIAPGRLGQLSRAVVQVASGGTGSFVSPRGLVATNHHVAYRCIAMLGSRKEHLGLLERGFLAKRETDELPCPGYDLLVVREVRDVKDQVLAAVKTESDCPAGARCAPAKWAARFEAIRLRKEELVAECEKDGKQLCEVSALDGGRGYLLSVYQRIRDVRLVYAPPLALGKYGGDIDNWMFPRHTADFAFLRAYVDRKGGGAPHAKGNVPLATRVHLQVSAAGIKERSLVTVVGFPARTSRHATSHQARFYIEQQIPTMLRLMRGLIAALNAERGKNEDVKRKYAALESGLQNAAKYYEMSRDGFARWKTLERKDKDEEELLARLADDKQAKSEAKALLGEIGKVFTRLRGYYARLTLLTRMSGLCPALRVAYDIAKWGKEKEKENRQRKEDRYKEKNVYRFIEAAERLEKEINPVAERALLLYLLREGEKLPRAQRPRSTATLLRWGAQELARAQARAKKERRPLSEHYREAYGVAPAADKLQAAVEMLYGATRLIGRGDDPKETERAVKLRNELFAKKSAQLARLDDPLLRLAREVEAELTGLKEGPYKEVEQHLDALLQSRWVEEFKKPAYPDANFTVRLSYGSARSYHSTATGRSHRYMTTLSELLAKDRGAFPFVVPQALRAAFPSRAKSRLFDRVLKDIPVNFTATLDTTGGNSGSPVLDDQGQLIGLLFDGTPESILSDWQFLPAHQRAICLDIRFALYLATVDKADGLIRELGVK